MKTRFCFLPFLLPPYPTLALRPLPPPLFFILYSDLQPNREESMHGLCLWHDVFYEGDLQECTSATSQLSLRPLSHSTHQQNQMNKFFRNNFHVPTLCWAKESYKSLGRLDTYKRKDD